MKRRLNFKCWHCQQEYSLQRNPEEGWPRLLVECPYCEEEAVVDLSPFRDETVSILKSSGTTEKGIEQLNLPDVLPTTPKPQEDDYS